MVRNQPQPLRQHDTGTAGEQAKGLRGADRWGSALRERASQDRTTPTGRVFGTKAGRLGWEARADAEHREAARLQRGECQNPPDTGSRNSPLLIRRDHAACKDSDTKLNPLDPGHQQMVAATCSAVGGLCQTVCPNSAPSHPDGEPPEGQTVPGPRMARASGIL